MKTKHITLCVGVLALAGALSVTAARAADAKSEAAKARKAEKDKEVLEKYDANHNGKLDTAEKAAKKVDDDKAKADRKEKKTKKDQEKMP